MCSVLAPQTWCCKFLSENPKRRHGNDPAKDQGPVQHLQLSEEEAVEVVMGGPNYVLLSTTLSFPN